MSLTSIVSFVVQLGQLAESLPEVRQAVATFWAHNTSVLNYLVQAKPLLLGLLPKQLGGTLDIPAK